MRTRIEGAFLVLLLLPLLASCTFEWTVVETATPLAVDTVGTDTTTQATTQATPAAPEPTATPDRGAANSTATSAPAAGQVPRATPPPILAQGWEKAVVHTICLSVGQSYENVEEEHTEPIAAEIGRLLSGVGIEVVEDRGSCEATLTLTLEMEALGANYSGDHYCYTGAEAEGTAVLSSGQYPSVTVLLRGEKKRELVLYSFTSTPCVSGPVAAPFEQAWLEAILKGLGGVWGPEVPAQILADEEGWRRRAAVRALGELGPEAAPYLLRPPQDGQQHYDRYFALCRIGPEIVPVLGEALEHENHYVRWDAAGALLCLGKKATATIPQLVDVLDDESYLVRKTAIEALGSMAPESQTALPYIVSALGDDESSVRQQAVYALARFGPEAIEAVPALIETISDENEYVREGAIKALQAITGQDFGQDASAWQAWWEEQP